MFSFIVNLIKALNPAQKNWQLSLAVCLGMLVGMSPLSNIPVLLALLMAFALNINMAAFVVSGAAFAVLSLLLAPGFDRLGDALLQMSAMREWWTWYYNLPYMRLTSFNHTLTMGSLAVSLVAFLPLFVVLQVVFRKYQSVMLRWLPLQLAPKEGDKVRLCRSGRIVFTVVLAGLVSAAIAVYVDPLLKHGIEQNGSQALQAQLSMDSLVSSLAACRLSVARLELANGDKLDENLVAVDDIQLRIDPQRLAQKKLLVEEAALEGLRFHQPRRTPAKSYRPVRQQTETPATNPEQLLAKWFKLDFASPDDILKNENLKSVQAFKDAQKEMEECKNKWQQRVKKDFGKEKLTGYQKKMADLEARSKKPNPLDIPKIVEEANKLTKDIDGDIKNIAAYKPELENDRARIEKLYAEIENAREQDIEMLKNKYVPSIDKLSLIESLLTPEGKARLQQLLRYYQMVQPYLPAHGKTTAGESKESLPAKRVGEYVVFRETDPIPDWVVKKGRLSVEWKGQKLSGQIDEWSSDPALYGKPGKLSLTASNTPLFASLALAVTIDRTADMRDTVALQVKGYKLPLTQIAGMVELKEGLVNLNGTIYVGNGGEISGHIRFDFAQAAIGLLSKEQNELAKTVAGALASVKNFYLQVTVSGKVDDFRLAVESDLDRIISEQVQNLVQNKAKEFASGLGKSVKLATPEAANIKNFAGNLNKLNTNITSQENELKKLLEQASKNFGADKLRQNVPGVPGIPGTPW